MKNNKIKIYKIRDKETGLFSKGGTSTYKLWSKDGKSWSNIGHLKNHLNQFLDGSAKCHYYPYNNSEIVEIEINYDECYSEDIDSLVDELVENKKIAEKKYEERIKKWREERELHQLAELKKKYEN